MTYFASHGSVWYTLEDGSQLMMNDLTVFANFNAKWREQSNLQLQYEIRDGDTPALLSNRLYDTVKYWWTILLINNISDMTEQWPRTYDDLNIYIEQKYPNNSKYDAHHYIDPAGLVVDLLSQRIKYGVLTDAEAIEEGGLEAVSIEEYETALNENKRNIILVDPDFISLVQKEYDLQMSEE